MTRGAAAVQVQEIEGEAETARFRPDRAADGVEVRCALLITDDHLLSGDPAFGRTCPDIRSAFYLPQCPDAMMPAAPSDARRAFEGFAKMSRILEDVPRNQRQSSRKLTHGDVSIQREAFIESAPQAGILVDS